MSVEEVRSQELKRGELISKNDDGKISDVDEQLTKLVFAYALSSGVWLILATLTGLYISFKFIWPELSDVSWLSYGRLRPIHTNSIFWGFGGAGMLALGNYIVPTTSRCKLHSYNLGWLSLIFINVGTTLGCLCLFLGINNGGQEYREFIWPVMWTITCGLLISGYNFYKTIANRETPEIYLSNWYILSAVIWTSILHVLAYIPHYQHGISETIIQGYYMHQSVGMWFTPFVVGTTYYFLPKLLNKPVYSYSLGVLAFWTQLVFYTMIGAHHFIFGPIPWWMQTVAIIFSIGMIVPVVAGTANFVLTMRGSFRTVVNSISLLFLSVGIFYYFIGSMEGSLEALRTSNIYWHFTNFTVGHSHTTLYGFVSFLVWGGIYALLPKLSGKKIPVAIAGAQLLFAFFGLFVMEVALTVGGIKQGISWVNHKPFIDSVNLMMPYWIWRSAGGLFMFISHILFFYNVWKMLPDNYFGLKKQVTYNEI